jgi:hypothetical protein
VIENIRKHIQDAFEAARSLGSTGRVIPKSETENCIRIEEALTTKQKQTHIPHYTETNARNFKLRGDTLVGAAMRISSVANSDKPQGNFHRPVTSYWAGDLDKNPLNAEAILLMCEELQAQKDAIRARRKQSFWNQTEKTK